MNTLRPASGVALGPLARVGGLQEHEAASSARRGERVKHERDNSALRVLPVREPELSPPRERFTRVSRQEYFNKRSKMFRFSRGSRSRVGVCITVHGHERSADCDRQSVPHSLRESRAVTSHRSRLTSTESRPLKYNTNTADARYAV
jgi:hypothetical protein